MTNKTLYRYSKNINIEKSKITNDNMSSNISKMNNINTSHKIVLRG